jgi:hypothetical protein
MGWIRRPNVVADLSFVPLRRDRWACTGEAKCRRILGDHHPRQVSQAPAQLLEEPLGGQRITTRARQDVEHTVLVNRATVASRLIELN